MMNKLAAVIGGGGGGGPPPPPTPTGLGSGQHIVLNRVASSPAAKSGPYVEQRAFGVVLKHQFESVNRQVEHGLAHVKRMCVFVEAVLKCLDNSSDARRVTSDLSQRWQEDGPLVDEMAHFAHATTLIDEVMLHTWSAHDTFRKAAAKECATLYAWYKTAQGRRRELVKDNQRMLSVWNGVEEALAKERRECAKAYSDLRLAQDAKDKEEMSETSTPALFPKLVKKWRAQKEATARKFALFEASFEKALALQQSNDAVSLPAMLAELEQIERDRLFYLTDFLQQFQSLFASWAAALASSSSLVDKVVPALDSGTSLKVMLDKFTAAYGPPPPLVPVRFDLPCTSAAINADTLPADSAPLLAHLPTSPASPSSAAAASLSSPSSATSPPPFPVAVSSPPRAQPAPFPTATRGPGTATSPAPLPKAVVPPARRPLPVATTPSAAAAAGPPPLPVASTASRPPPLPSPASGGPPPLPSSSTTAAAPTPATVPAAASPTGSRPPPVSAVSTSAAAAAAPKPLPVLGVFSKNSRAPPPSLPQKRKPKAAGDIELDPSDLPPPPLPPLVTTETPSYRASRASISHRKQSIVRVPGAQPLLAEPPAPVAPVAPAAPGAVVAGMALPATAVRVFPMGLPARVPRGPDGRPLKAEQAAPEPSPSDAATAAPLPSPAQESALAVPSPAPTLSASPRGPPPLPGSARTSLSGPPPLPPSFLAQTPLQVESLPTQLEVQLEQPSEAQPEPLPQPLSHSQPEPQPEPQPQPQAAPPSESAAVEAAPAESSPVQEAEEQQPTAALHAGPEPQATAEEQVEPQADEASGAVEGDEEEEQADPVPAIALYDFSLSEDTVDIHYLSFSAGEAILVHSYPEGEDWWYGQLESGDMGFFAANYVELQTHATDEAHSTTAADDDQQ